MNPKTSECASCHEQVPTAELDADDRCEICASLDKLHDTLTEQGKMKPTDQQGTLPYKDE